MENKIIITEWQLGKIGDYAKMFEIIAEKIEELCNTERYDIVYGFELGKIHTSAHDCFIALSEIKHDIEGNKL